MKAGWLKIKDAPLGVAGLVWCPVKSWGGRTDSIGTICEFSGGERFAIGNFHGFKITHWHPLPKPPRACK